MLVSAKEAKAQVYVDDLAFTLAGVPARRRRCKAVIVLAWRILNLELAFKKARAARRSTGSAASCA